MYQIGSQPCVDLSVASLCKIISSWTHECDSHSEHTINRSLLLQGPLCLSFLPLIFTCGLLLSSWSQFICLSSVCPFQGSPVTYIPCFNFPQRTFPTEYISFIPSFTHVSVHAYSDVNSIHIEEGIMKSVRLWTLEVGAVQEKELALCARVGKKVLQGRLWS